MEISRSLSRGGSQAFEEQFVHQELKVQLDDIQITSHSNSDQHSSK